MTVEASSVSACQRRTVSASPEGRSARAASRPGSVTARSASISNIFVNSSTLMLRSFMVYSTPRK